MPIVIEGFEELQRAFRRAHPRELRKVARQAARQAGQPMLRDARREAPRGETLRLSRGISLRATKRSRVYVGVKVQLPTREKLGLPVFAAHPGYYPAAVHYGWAHYRRGKRVEGDPFLERAFDRHQAAAARLFRARLTEFLEALR